MRTPVAVGRAEAKTDSGVLARAFQDDPLWAYFFRYPAARPNKLLHVFHMFVDHGISQGEVYATSPNLERVAVRLPSDKADMLPWRMMRSGGFSAMLGMGAGAMVRAMRYTEYATAIHQRRAHFPHQYHQFIGVDPASQGNGYASVLLKPMLARLDAEQTACYLETQTQENVPIYQHYGFRVVEEGTIPGTDVGHWAMLR